METIAETDGKLEDTIVCSKNKDVACGIENCRTYLAVFQMPLHHFSHFGRQGIVQITGDVVPNVFALDYHRNHLLFGFAVFSCGASAFCSMIRARWRRVLTEATEIASSVAVSSTLNSSTSRSNTTSR